MRDGPADGHVVLLRAFDLVPGGKRGVLRRAVHMQQREIRSRGHHAVDVRDRNFFSTRQHMTQAAKGLGIEVCHLVEESRGDEAGRRAHRGQQRAELVDFQDLFPFRQAAAAAVEQGTPNLKCRRIESQRPGLQHTVARPELEEVGRAHQAHHRMLFDQHALGLTGGAGGKNNIGQSASRSAPLVHPAARGHVRRTAAPLTQVHIRAIPARHRRLALDEAQARPTH